mmetsp:Transcript_53880/g.165790  ORF Transcript_53880/g.165790 Transcript_53880/m.165790 type:complete len:420 (+) Transcript_53880:50-1309(+)
MTISMQGRELAFQERKREAARVDHETARKLGAYAETGMVTCSLTVCVFVQFNHDGNPYLRCSLLFALRTLCAAIESEVVVFAKVTRDDEALRRVRGSSRPARETVVRSPELGLLLLGAAQRIAQASLRRLAHVRGHPCGFVRSLCRPQLDHGVHQLGGRGAPPGKVALAQREHGAVDGAARVVAALVVAEHVEPLAHAARVGLRVRRRRLHQRPDWRRGRATAARQPDDVHKLEEERGGDVAQRAVRRQHLALRAVPLRQALQRDCLHERRADGAVDLDGVRAQVADGAAPRGQAAPHRQPVRLRGRDGERGSRGTARRSGAWAHGVKRGAEVVPVEGPEHTAVVSDRAGNERHQLRGRCDTVGGLVGAHRELRREAARVCHDDRHRGGVETAIGAEADDRGRTALAAAVVLGAAARVP